MTEPVAAETKPTLSSTPSKIFEAEKEAQWELPSTPVVTSSRRKAGKPAVHVSTVESYLPFMGEDDDRGEGSSAGGMSGRLSFGAAKRRRVSVITGTDVDFYADPLATQVP